MQDDPIVEEIRKVRDQLASEVGYDVRALGRKLQKSQKAGKHKVVSVPQKSDIDEFSAPEKRKARNSK